ncbi:MAG: CubicO group peptidase (beta-lactamase class C family) [Limisphaerales bacterium]|jgi:CubicO group peptidase (beta-lactamase class C family)
MAGITCVNKFKAVNNRYNRTLILLLIWGLAANSVNASAQNWQELAKQLNEDRLAENVPVLALALFDNFEPAQLVVFGAADVDTPLRWGSITKTFTAITLSNLVEAKGLNWDDPITGLIKQPPWINQWSTNSPVTYRHLAELCAGLTDLSFTEFNDNVPHLLREVLVRPSESRRQRWPPGFQHSYTNVNPGLSAYVIEQLSGESFDHYLSKHVFEPLGMPSASIRSVPGLPGGYQVDGRTKIPYWHMTYPSAGGLNASLTEVSNAASTILNGGINKDGNRVLSKQTLHRLTNSRCGLASTGLAVAYAAGMYGRVREGFVFYGHGGDADGYRSRFGLLPSHGRGYVVLINTDNPKLLNSLEKKITVALTRDLKPPAMALAKVESSANLTQWAGTYYPSNTRFAYARWLAGSLPTREISATETGLLVTSAKRQVHLYALGRNLFRRKGDPIATVAFAKTPQGTVMQGELGNFVRIDVDCPSWIGVACAQPAPCLTCDRAANVDTPLPRP